MLRSQDPLFGVGMQAMTSDGGRPIADQYPGTVESQARYQSRTSYSTIEAFSVDWTFSDMLNGFVRAHDNEAGITDLDVWSNLDWGHWKLSPGQSHDPRCGWAGARAPA